MGKEAETFLRIGEVAERMHCCETTVRRWIDQGFLKAKRIGPTFRIPESALAALPDALNGKKEKE